MIGPDDLHRLRQMRDDLDWLYIEIGRPEYKNTPYNHYTTQVNSTSQVVYSIIRSVEGL